jgi:hypothetical protein
MDQMAVRRLPSRPLSGMKGSARVDFNGTLAWHRRDSRKRVNGDLMELPRMTPRSSKQKMAIFLSTTSSIGSLASI